MNSRGLNVGYSTAQSRLMAKEIKSISSIEAV
jgi:hypothetical protein